jgi:PAS domain S-box-containing protein
MRDSVHRGSRATKRDDLRHAEAERARMEQALRESEELIRLAMQAGRMFAFEWSPGTDEVRRSQDAAEVIGFTGDATRDAGQESVRRIHPEDRERLIRTVKSLTPANDNYKTEYRVIFPSGQIATFEQNARAFFDDGGRMIRLVGMTADITERKRTEEGLKVREAELRQLIQKLPIAIASADEHGRIDYVNDQFLTNFGYTLDEIGDPDAWWEHAYPDERYRREVLNSWGNSVEQASREGQRIKPCEYRVTCKDGTVRVAEILGATIGDRKLILFNDLTERKQAEATLRESEERFRNMADTAPVMIWVAGPDKLCTFFNKRWLDFTGRTMEQELGDGWTGCVHPEDLDRCLGIYSSSFDARCSLQMEYRLRRADGEYRCLLDNGVPRFEPEGGFVGYIGSCIDITDLKRAHEEHLAKQKLASVGTLAGGIAHDFNNLLGGILAHSELALQDFAGGGRPEEELKRIRAATIRGAEIVRQLMTYSGQQSEVLEQVDVSQIVEDMFELLRVSVSKHAVVELDLGKDLPVVRASPGQLRQVVMNLIINASEAIGDRDGVIHVNTTGPVRIGGEPGANPEHLTEGDYLCLEIYDTGRGMTPETQARIFDPFFTTKLAGRGLGLAVVQGIVQSLGGKIRLTSAPGQGTKVQILLPCGEGTGQATGSAIPRGGEEKPATLEATILVVEDEESLRKPVSKMLRRMGLSVIEAADGSAAMDLVRAHSDQIDVLFLDITLPGTSSGEVFEEARRLRPDMPVIVTSAYSEDTAALSLAGKGDHFIRKPYRLDHLVGLIRGVLAKHT